MGERVKKSNLHSCNVLDVGASGGLEAKQIWRFSAGNGEVSLTAEQRVVPPEPLPAKLVAKDWRTLWQRKLNIAWFPADQVFLRVAHLPAADRGELLAMVELQLEKLSPLPVTQIVWSVEFLPQHAENMQTVIVVIAARAVVEEFLGKLEGDGYQPDRLEIPQLHELLATRFEENGIWIYPSREGTRNLCLVAWWYGGALQQLQLVHLPESPNRGALLVEQLTKAAWAGEMEGWFTVQTRCHVAGDEAALARWEPALSQWAGHKVTLVDPLSKTALAELAARLAARNESPANLLPAEHAARYQQRFIDRLWMSGLGAVIAAYVVGVIIYFAALQVIKFQKYSLDKQVASVSDSYTNAVKLKERVEVLQNQLNLKYAALDSLRAVSELLPPDLTLTEFALQRGQELRLQGTAPSQDQVNQLFDYNAALRKVTANGELVFSKVEQPIYDTRGQTIAWRFNSELKRAETQ